MRAGEPSLMEDESECDSTQPAVTERTAQKQGPPLGRPSLYITFGVVSFSSLRLLLDSQPFFAVSNWSCP